MKGYVQVYTGNGKGKTTAALGLTLRAVGAGYKIFIGQFVKGMTYAELESLGRLTEQVTVRQYGRDVFIRNNPKPEDIEKAKAGLDEIRAAATSGEYQVVIMDEGNIATSLKLIDVDDILELIETKHEGTELIITGRNADPKLIERADLVTEMKEVKHYYKEGVKARVGIEK
ncbi:MAG: cob(I)yrinic acid a,c-diamide adenosyltransferase [Proteobacteria bacterium]|nr:cob(I)yrinic acid a,c-diamide adenosyltransferase [Pseudomonadota bacterium]